MVSTISSKKVKNTLCGSHSNQGDFMLSFWSKAFSTFPLSSTLWFFSFHFSWGAFLYDTWSVSLNCTSSFSDCRFPGKLQLHFGALEEGWKEARQNELTLSLDRRDHEKSTLELGISHESCCIPFCVLHLQRQAMLLRISKLFLRWRSRTHLKKNMFIT